LIWQDLSGRVGSFEVSFRFPLRTRRARDDGDTCDAGFGEGLGDAVADTACAAGDQNRLALAIEAVVSGDAVVGRGMVRNQPARVLVAASSTQ
jgi:hypothetical protein